jgi:hypothetical protein
VKTSPFQRTVNPQNRRLSGTAGEQKGEGEGVEMDQGKNAADGALESTGEHWKALEHTGARWSTWGVNGSSAGVGSTVQ